MRFTVKLFAAARQFVGAEEIDVDLPEGATVADLRSALAEDQPALEKLLPSAMIAIDTDYVGNDRIVPPNAEIALIPPVSGG